MLDAITTLYLRQREAAGVPVDTYGWELDLEKLPADVRERALAWLRGPGAPGPALTWGKNE